MAEDSPKSAKRYLKIAFGFTLLAVGLLMILTPGPGWPMILLALSVLAAEYLWARRLLERLKAQGNRLRSVLRPAGTSQDA
jgi:Flp pilus assembly protein TadB